GALPKAPMMLTGVSQMVMMAFGVDPADVHSVNLSQTEALEGLKAGTLDAWFTSDADVLAHLPPTGNRLIPIEGPPVDRVRLEYSFIRPVTVPAGTYPGQSAPLHTVGIDVVLVCRSDLDEQLVYDLTRAQLAAPPSVWAVSAAQPPPDLEKASATPIP